MYVCMYVYMIVFMTALKKASSYFGKFIFNYFIFFRFH